MTYNEFKMCCTLFCKHFNGQKYGSIIKDCYSSDVDILINDRVRYENIDYGELVRLYFNDKYMARFNDDSFMIITKRQNLNFYNTIDFLKYFKIPSEDIV